MKCAEKEESQAMTAQNDREGKMDEPKVYDLNGNEVSEDSPDRFLWYGVCGRWTVRPETLLKGVPRCPDCGGPGFQTTVGEWESGIKNWEKDHPGYSEEIEKLKDVCGRARRKP